MPRRIAPGGLGMARTMRAFGPHALRSAATEVPAAMEIISDVLAMAASAGASPFRICGLIATMQASNLPLTCDGVSTNAMALARPSALISADGFGSTTMMDLTLLACQPFSSAEPM